jgi:hypothetical protein
MTKRKKTNNDLEKITPKTKDRLTRTLLKTEGELWCAIIRSCLFSQHNCIIH